jgi:hypothetical protein
VSLLIAGLYSGKLTYADFAKERALVENEAMAARQDWLQALAIIDQQRREREEQLAEQRYEAWLQSFAANTAQLRPIDCTTVHVGDIANTSCR